MTHAERYRQMFRPKVLTDLELLRVSARHLDPAELTRRNFFRRRCTCAFCGEFLSPGQIHDATLLSGSPAFMCSACENEAATKNWHLEQGEAVQ